MELSSNSWSVPQFHLSPELKGQKITQACTSDHTCACHLLRSGVDINTIRDWLGHVSVATTNIYAEVDLKAKRQRR